MTKRTGPMESSTLLPKIQEEHVAAEVQQARVREHAGETVAHVG
jgi:hypothetical protein